MRYEEVVIGAVVVLGKSSNRKSLRLPEGFWFADELGRAAIFFGAGEQRLSHRSR